MTGAASAMVHICSFRLIIYEKMSELLLITGKLAEEQVRECAQELGADVLALPVSVAQFIGPKLASSRIKDLGKTYGRIIFPGLVRFDVSKVEREVGMPCFKGPKHPCDLIEVLKKGLHLSKTQSADALMEKSGEEDYKKLVEEAEKSHKGLTVGGLKVAGGLPPRIIAEIVDAPLLSDEQLTERAQYYLNSGADIIDVGAIAAEDNSKRLGQAVALLKKRFSVPVSIDALNPKEINAGIGAGAELVLSLCGRNMEQVTKSDDVAYVVIAEEDEDLRDNIRRAQELGFKNLIADPILAPPFRIARSLAEYRSFAQAPGMPLLMGIGNVTEMMDVDSPGVNGLLAAIAVELDVSLMLTTENSHKTRNSVRELKRAIKLMFLARSKGTLPKDLGFDLLLAKGKGEGLSFDLGDAKVMQVLDSSQGFRPDPKGHFNVFVDFGKNKIIAAHFKDDFDRVLSGDSAEALSKEIIDKGLVSDLNHAAYLGRELQKAELCLKLGRGYVQDDDLPGL